MRTPDRTRTFVTLASAGVLVVASAVLAYSLATPTSEATPLVPAIRVKSDQTSTSDTPLPAAEEAREAAKTADDEAVAEPRADHAVPRETPSTGSADSSDRSAPSADGSAPSQTGSGGSGSSSAKTAPPYSEGAAASGAGSGESRERVSPPVRDDIHNDDEPEDRVGDGHEEGEHSDSVKEQPPEDD